MIFYGAYLAHFKNKTLESLIYPFNEKEHAITKNGGLPIGMLKAGEYSIHFFLLIIFTKTKSNRALRTELRKAPTKLRSQYLLFFLIHSIFGLLFISLFIYEKSK